MISQRMMATPPRLTLALVALAGLALAAAATGAAAEPVDPRRLWVVDGDSLALCPDPGDPGDRAARRRAGCEEIRLRGAGRGLDAPELLGRCAREREAARAAKARLIALLRGARRAEIARAGRDRYGRSLARLALDGADAGAALLAAGLALPWAPGPEARRARSAHWCGPGQW